jgi:hypothetical protein
MAQVTQYLLGNREVLNSNTSPTQKNLKIITNMKGSVGWLK